MPTEYLGYGYQIPVAPQLVETLRLTMDGAEVRYNSALRQRNYCSLDQRTVPSQLPSTDTMLTGTFIGCQVLKSSTNVFDRMVHVNRLCYKVKIYAMRTIGIAGGTRSGWNQSTKKAALFKLCLDPMNYTIFASDSPTRSETSVEKLKELSREVRESIITGICDPPFSSYALVWRSFYSLDSRQLR
jgi:hypothetical protein